jgi:hypothetical protein
MPAPAPEEALRKLRRLYRDAHHLTNQAVDDSQVLNWASTGPLSSWATHKIRHGGWSYLLVEGTVRSVRQLQRRAIEAIPQTAVAPESSVQGLDPFDPLLPTAEQQGGQSTAGERVSDLTPRQQQDPQ